MHKENLHENISNRKDCIFHKGQLVLFKGREANILNVRPVFTLRINGKCEIIYGNTLPNEVSPYRN
jgi:hypothetical protein